LTSKPVNLLEIAERMRTVQGVQKGRSARPQWAKRRILLWAVRWASKRYENAAGGLFQYPAR